MSLTPMFGNYVKFYVQCAMSQQRTSNVPAIPQCRNAFDIMMAAAA